jgi:hypothetical protein
MAAWDHADLLGQPAKALIYPHYCDDDELKTAIIYLKQGYHSGKGAKKNDRDSIMELQLELENRRTKKDLKKWEY